MLELIKDYIRGAWKLPSQFSYLVTEIIRCSGPKRYHLRQRRTPKVLVGKNVNGTPGDTDHGEKWDEAG